MCGWHKGEKHLPACVPHWIFEYLWCEANAGSCSCNSYWLIEMPVWRGVSFWNDSEETSGCPQVNVGVSSDNRHWLWILTTKSGAKRGGGNVYKKLKKTIKDDSIWFLLLTSLWIPSPELNLQHLSRLLDKVFLIFPNYCLGMSFSQFYQNYEFISFCTSSPISVEVCKYLSK